MGRPNNLATAKDPNWDHKAFTIIELLVVIILIAILAALLLPLLAQAKATAQSAVCSSNLRQFSYAWIMYAQEQNDRLPPNEGDQGRTGGPSTLNTWVVGRLEPTADWADNTNVNYLKGSILAPYLKTSLHIWKCPADKSTALHQGKPLPRVRSFSMNGFLTDQDPNGSQPLYKMNTRLSDMVNPPPAGTWVFTDEREDSIQDSVFSVDMSNGPAGLAAVPGIYHRRSGNFSFADGHAERRKWIDRRTVPPLRKGQFVNVLVTFSPPNPDVVWLQQRTTGLRR